MTRTEIEALSRQATKAAARVSTWPAWQQALAASVAEQSGTDREPRVSPVVVTTVQRVLLPDSSDRDEA